jgi:hypothetical protein
MRAKKLRDNRQNVHPAKHDGRSNVQIASRVSIFTAQRALSSIEFIERGSTWRAPQLHKPFAALFFHYE